MRGTHTAGVGKGLLGVVGLPLSGALGLVGAVSSGLASTAGLAPAQAVRRPGHCAGLHTSLFHAQDTCKFCVSKHVKACIS